MKTIATIGSIFIAIKLGVPAMLSVYAGMAHLFGGAA